MSKIPSVNKAALCPCGSKKLYLECCRLLHEGSPASSAEALMRSRYSAYVLDLQEYIKGTWHPSTYPEAIKNEDVGSTQWLGLQVKRHESLDASHAVVEFIARYKVAGKAFRLHEVSRFIHENGRWLYLDGQHN